MKAIILASGVGRRLRPLTDDVPKALVDVGGQAIIDRQLESLAKYGIRSIVVTTGHLREKLERHVRGKREFSVRFVHNPDYERTNYIYSLWLARDCIDDDVILLHSDVVFDDAVLKRFTETRGNRVLVNRAIPAPAKDFKALVENGRVKAIGVDLRAPNAFFCAPFYRLTKPGLLTWLERIDDFVSRGKTDCYAEDAFNEISDRVVLRPLYVEQFCIEIDTVADLETAREWVERNLTYRS